MPFAAIDDIELYYESHGSGPPLVLSAGVASDSRTWLPILPRLMAEHRVIVLDQRGTGRTRPHDAAMGIEQSAADIIALARYLGLQRIALLGHSMGALTALAVTHHAPDLVGHLRLASSSPWCSVRNRRLFHDWAVARRHADDLEPWFRNLFYWLFSPRFFETEAAVAAAERAAVDDPYRQSSAAFEQQVVALCGCDARPWLSGVRVPTRVIAGSEDILYPPASTKTLAAESGKADFVLIEHAAHAVFIENPEDFCAAVLDFLGAA